MKAFVVVAALAGVVQAQDPDGLPPCGQICINNMLALAPSLGCPPGDTACLCGKDDFGYGVRDCAVQACDASDASAVVSYGANICANAAPSGPAVSAMGVAPSTSTVIATLTDASETLISTASGSDVPLETLVPLLVSTFTSGNNTITTTVPDSLATASGTAVTVVSSGPGGVNATLTTNLAASGASSSSLSSSASGTATGGDGADARTSSSSSARSSSTSEAGAMPLVTVAVDGLFVGAMGAAAVMWF
ncbi:hypothetical protein B0T25DRAFT_356622 [Lasiosphaeria hispida]|uniref:CFEM domain-containing protein n=1 Tax=Lasiosphaeria hispida TaxID=260671 RepID=A0AAJ0H7A5_9PEZI|nr:hypothetical protein B0T25DRAFT_356622 [Lasiosphaeria hispida]